MTHYAFLDENNIVTEIIIGSDARNVQVLRESVEI